MDRANLTQKAKSFGRMLSEMTLETIWPTRCAVCDTPGENVLCEHCASRLPYVDMTLACPRCGSPFGRIQCTECNDVELASLNLETLPVDSMVHVTAMTDESRRLVTIYKDADERRLAHVLADMLARYISPDRVREHCVATYIPDTAEAVRRRGFDHAREIAIATAECAGIDCACLIERPKSSDQRKLGKRERIANMRDAVHVIEGAPIPESLLLIDDVCTTGATIYSAASALKAAGAKNVHAITFTVSMS